MWAAENGVSDGRARQPLNGTYVKYVPIVNAFKAVMMT